MEIIRFKLNDKLSKFDEMGEGYVYELTEHQERSYVMEVHFYKRGHRKSALFKKREVDRNFREGAWIKLDDDSSKY